MVVVLVFTKKPGLYAEVVDYKNANNFLVVEISEDKQNIKRFDYFYISEVGIEELIKKFGVNTLISKSEEDKKIAEKYNLNFLKTDKPTADLAVGDLMEVEESDEDLLFSKIDIKNKEYWKEEYLKELPRETHKK